MSAQVPLNLDDIQGDVLQGLPKKFQTFIFFAITHPSQFKWRFKAIIPFITNTSQVLADEAAIAAHKASGAKGLIKLTGTNVAFSSRGLIELGIKDDLGDPIFKVGQLADAKDRTNGINDPLTSTGDPDWDAEFLQTIHGCLLITGDSKLTIDIRKAELEAILIGTIKIVTQVEGVVRPGDEAGHEHFGFKDSISNPPVNGFRPPNAGEDPVDPGVILIGEPGDNDIPVGTAPPRPTPRPAWAKDSSFLVFRKLRQYVPEFDDFLKKNPIPDPGLTPAQGSELLGARLVGRWKSGVPIDRDPVQDNPNDTTPDTVNNFDYSDDPDEIKCPYAAHLRKVNPRNANPGGGGFARVKPRRMIRQGIPYGPEVDKNEASSATSKHDRGLLFAGYQSSVERGFHFVQRTWANNPGFPVIQSGQAGFDPIIGQSADGVRTMNGTDPKATATPLSLPPAFVVPRGGEYFLVPSISALKEKIAYA